MNKLCILLITALLSNLAFAEPFIILFKESTAKTGNYAKNSRIYKEANHKNIQLLEEFLSRKNSTLAIKQNLWLIQGAAIDLKEEERKALIEEPFIDGIYPDQFRNLINLPQLQSNQNIQEEDGLWGLRFLGVDKIRQDFPFVNGTGVRVGILDTGIQSGHPEFESLGSAVQFKDFVNGIPYPYDDHGHGTHVAGSIAGLEVGIAPKASLVVGKILSAKGSAFDSWILEGMQWIYDPDGDEETMDHPHVVNNSWGMNLPMGVVDLARFEPYRRGIQAWIHNGIIPVFAAGNSGSFPNSFPAALPEVLAIGATTPNGGIASFSSRGPNIWSLDNIIISLAKPDFSAPGVDILSTIPNNSYTLMSGTSMATPYAVGSISLLLQLNPKFGVKEVKQELMRTSHYKFDLGFGLGIINAYELVRGSLGK